MKKNEHILLSYKFANEELAKPISPRSISKELKDKNLAWVHLDANHPDTRVWLEKEIKYLDHFIIDALLAEETRPRIIEIGDGALINLRGVNLNKNSDPEDMVSIRMWVDKSRIISLQKRNIKAIDDIEKNIKNNKSPKNAGDFLCSLISKLFARIETVLSDLDDKTDNIEEQILDKPDPSFRDNIINIRKQAIMLRRYMAPQKDVIGFLRSSNINWLDTNHKRHLQENHDRITRYVEDLDAIRERAQIVKDELANILTDRLNKNTYILSVIASIFLPLGFLTGLLGINIEGIPGATNQSAFYIFCGIITLITAIQVIIFKKLKWF